MAGIAEKHKLHDLCHNGKLRQVKEYLASDPNASTSINEQAGVFGYTPMHEAVSSKNDHILQLLLTYGGQVNALSNGKYTPLHIAASIGCVECIKILLEYNADISLVDEFGKTPFATAQLNKRKRAARVLKTAEIKRMAATEDFRLGKAIETLQCGKDVEQNCFEEALQIAVQKNNHKSVGYLVIHGAKNVEECLHAALLKPFLHQTAALLLLCHAAKNGDDTMIRHLCEGLKTTNFADDSILDQMSETDVVLTKKYLPEKWNRRLTQRKLWDMRKAACSIDMAFPISIALNECHYEVAKIIVFEKYCDQKRGEADWHGLALPNIRNCWIDEIKGYKKLVLAHNVLHSVPQNIINMKNLLRLDLSKNYIVEIPKEIFELPLLRNLNLSYNDITHLPRVNEWNKSMKILNLQANNLKTIDDSIDQSELEDLNLSENNLLSIADCICRIKTLTTLDISSNRLITVFPPELAKLSKLSFFGMRNMDQVTDPPPDLRSTISGLLRHLRAKLRNSEAYYTMKLMIVGLANQGKTTLMHRLDKDFAFNQNQSTKGVEIKEIIISRARSFVFKFWDFAGQEEYYATHQCFLSQRSMYLLVWKVTDGENGIIGLKPWLDNLETRVPNSTVIIVGTHLDEIPEEEKAKGFEVEMNQKICELLRTYKKINNPENAIIMVTSNVAVRECKEKIERLRQLIYTVAENMTVTGSSKGPKIMGEMIPSSYLSLEKIIAKHQTELQEQNEMPILRKHQFEALVSENAKKNTKDIFDPDDVDIATKFLHDIGTILHYDDPNQDLRDLYFVNPSWLCELMAKVVTVKEAQSFIKDGILYRKDIEFIIGRDRDKFPKQFYSQYLRLLYRFQIACRLDEDRVLIPSQLPKDFPLEEARSIEPNHVLQRQHSFSCIPQGFWSRFIGRFLLYLKDMLTINMELKSDSINDLHPEPGMEVSRNSVTAEYYGVSQYELPSSIEKRQPFQSDKDVNDTKNAKEELSIAESKVISDVGGPIDISAETFNSEEELNDEKDGGKCMDPEGSKVIKDMAEDKSTEGKNDKSANKEMPIANSKAINYVKVDHSVATADIYNSKEEENFDKSLGRDMEINAVDGEDGVVEDLSKSKEAEKIESYQGKDDSHIEQDLDSFKDNVIEDISQLEEVEKNNRNLNQGPKQDQSSTTESVKNVNDSTGARETDPEDITTRAAVRLRAELMENGQVPFLLNNMIIEKKSPPSVASSISIEEEYSAPTSREATPLSVPETFSSASSECSTPITSRPCSSAKEDRSQSFKMKHTSQRIEAIASLTDMHHCQTVQDECSNVDEAEFNEPVDISYLLGKKYLRCWRKGILFSHPKLFLSVSVIPSNSDRQIIETRVSRNLLGYRALSFIVDHIRTLIKEWYPGLSGDNGLVPYVRQLVSCPTCTDFGFKPPFMFDISDCYRSSITQEYIVCSNNHMPQTVSLRELCPDIMFMDLPSSLQLNPQDLSCFEAEDYLLGSGQFGKVYRGAYKGKPAAIKLSNFSGDENNLREALDNFYDVRQEVIILSKVKKHPYIISFLGVSVRPKLYSVMELATQGTLRKAIKGQMGHIKRIIIYRIAQQMASALSYLHQLGIVHRDLKSDNVLVFSTDPTSEINAKLTDFGTADFMSCTGLKFCTGTPGFVAPEILEYSKKDEYTAKVDVYSFAMVLYESITKRRPFQDIAEDVLEISRQVKERKRPFFGDLKSTTYGFLTLTELMMKAWDQEAMKRPSSYDIWQQLKSPSFCLLFGKISLGQIQSPRQQCFIAESSELWVCCDDKSGASIVVLDIATAKEKTRFIPMLNKAKDSCYNVVHISLVDKSHVAVILRSTTDYVVIYSTNRKKCVESYQVKDSYIKSLTVSENYVILGFEDGSFLRVTKRDFIRGRFREKNTLVNEKRAISALITSESSLFVGCDKYVYKYPLNFKQQESVEMEDMRSGNEKQHVEMMMISPDGLMLFISFRGSPIITCRLVENMNSLGEVDCSDVVKILVPHSDVNDQRVTCFCVQLDTLWIGTGSGHILIYGIRIDCAPSFISWLRPYNLEVRCMISCNSVGSENFVVTIGKELNPQGLSHHMQGLCQLNMTFPVDESLLKKKPRGKKEDKKDLVPENSVTGRKNVLLVWDAVDAATLKRISSLQ